MNHARFPLSAGVTLVLVTGIMLAGLYDPNGASEGAYLLRMRPVAYWASAIVWFLLFAPVWLPSLFAASRLRVAVDYLFGGLGLALAVLFLQAFSGSTGPYVPLFFVACAVLAWFSVWHLLFAWSRRHGAVNDA